MPSFADFQRLEAVREANRRGMLGPSQQMALTELEKRFNQYLEPATTVATSAIAEPVSGLAGIAGSILPGPAGQGADWTRRTQEALTYQPRTYPGIGGLRGLGEFMQPVSDVMQAAERFSGDVGYDLFGETGGALMATIPAAISEAAGVGKPARAVDKAADASRVARRLDDMGLDDSARQSRKYTADELMEMDVDELDKMAFGVTSGEVKTISPDDLNVIYDDDMLNPQEAFRRGGKEWAESVDLSEPIQVSVDETGAFNIEDGHHRYFAAKLLGKPIKAEFEVKGNPARAILKRQGDM